MRTTETFQLQLVSYQQGLALKELGFDWPVTDFFHENLEQKICDGHDDSDNYNSDDWGKDYVNRPSILLAFKWLREVKGIHIYTYLNAGKDGYSISMDHTDFVREENDIPVHALSYESNSVAESIALACILTYLMDIKTFQIRCEISEKRKDMQENVLKVDNTVFFTWTESCDTGAGGLLSHVFETRSVVLRGKVTKVGTHAFRAQLIDNNGFEKDGNEYVFHNGTLLANQNFTDLDRLGKWYKDK